MVYAEQKAATSGQQRSISCLHISICGINSANKTRIKAPCGKRIKIIAPYMQSRRGQHTARGPLTARGPHTARKGQLNRSFQLKFAFETQINALCGPQTKVVAPLMMSLHYRNIVHSGLNVRKSVKSFKILNKKNFQGRSSVPIS